MPLQLSFWLLSNDMVAWKGAADNDLLQDVTISPRIEALACLYKYRFLFPEVRFKTFYQGNFHRLSKISRPSTERTTGSR